MENDTPPSHVTAPSGWWFVAVLLLMFAVLMVSHIGMLWVQVAQCDGYFILRMQEVSDYLKNPLREGKSISEATALPRAEQCREVHNDFNQVANIYLTAILALLSGAGFSTGREMSLRRSEKP